MRPLPPSCPDTPQPGRRVLIDYYCQLWHLLRRLRSPGGRQVVNAKHTAAGRGAESGGLSALIDRWIYVFMAALFIATVLTGFIPSSLALIEDVTAGQRPPLPPILHAHAIVMGAWLLLLLGQTGLMASGHRSLHRQLGIAATVLVPAIFLVQVILIPTIYRGYWELAQAAPPGDAGQGADLLWFVEGILLAQIHIAVLFPVLVTFALRARRANPGFHKRMMILATVVLMPPATDRIAWLPTSLPGNPITIDLYMLVLLVPIFFWDLLRAHRVHSAYWVFLALSIPFIVAKQLLWDSSWWHATAPLLMGVG